MSLAYGYNEMSFLYDTSLTTPIGNYKGMDTRSNKKTNPDDEYNQDSIFNTVPTSNTVVFKHPSAKNTTGIKNYLTNVTERPYQDDANPYSKLVRDFSQPEFKAMKLRPADLVYLRNMGVYPINRMWILRRFADGVVVPNNLNTWSMSNCPQPVATAVGWVKSDGTNDKIFGFSFNEGWTVQTKMIHEVISQILENEFGSLVGTGAKMLMPSANWSQGLVFGFLNTMGLTVYDSKNVPIGDPNVLMESPMREGGGGGDDWKYTLRSAIEFDLETEYEQKLIGSVDPGSAMMDIFQNMLKIGTSNVKYMLKPGNAIINDLLKANQAGGDKLIEGWKTAITSFVNAVTSAIGDLAAKMGEHFGQLTDAGGGGPAPEKTLKGAAEIDTGVKLFTSLVTTILASTIVKYRWPMQGAIGLMTGINTAPWHLTIGNPYSPILSMANIVVETVNVEGSMEQGYNDMPKRLKYTIKCKVGRNVGGQEIMQMFNNSYFRVYSKDDKAIQNAKLTTFNTPSPNGIPFMSAQNKDTGTVQSTSLNSGF